jgi:hypothetical protein
MGLGYNKQVRRCFGHDIPESQEIFILIDYVGRQLTGNDATKNTFFAHNPAPSTYYAFVP